MPAKRPKTFTKKLQEDYLDRLKNGVRRGAAAEEIGLPRKLVLDHIALHDDFEAKVIDAEAEATEHVEEALYQAAISGNVAAAKIWLDYKAGRGGLPDKGDWDVNKEMARLNAMAGD